MEIQDYLNVWGVWAIRVVLLAEYAFLAGLLLRSPYTLARILGVFAPALYSYWIATHTSNTFALIVVPGLAQILVCLAVIIQLVGIRDIKRPKVEDMPKPVRVFVEYLKH